MTAHLADQICIWAAVLIPLPLIVAFRWVGVALGAFFVWLILLIAGIWISALDPTHGNAGIDTIWLAFGWIGGLIYCLPIFGMREWVARLLRNRRKIAGGKRFDSAD